MLHILHMGGKLRPGLLVLVPLGLVQHRVVIGGVGVYQRHLKKFRPGLPLNFLRNTLGISSPGEIGDEHLPASGAFVFLPRRRAGDAAGSGNRVQHQSDADVKAPLVLLHGRPVGRTHIFGKVVPAAAPVDLSGAGFRPGGVGLLLRGVGAVIIPHPFPHIAVHIVQAKGVGGKAVRLHSGLPVLARLGGQSALGKIIILDLIGIVPVVVGFLRADRGLGVEGGLRSRPAGVFPFGLGGKAVAVSAPVPGDAASVNGINRGASLRLAEGVAVGHGLEPGNVFYRQLLPRKITGIAAHDPLIFRLGQLIPAHIKIADGDGVQAFVIAAPGFGFRAAHLEGPAWDQHKAFRNGSCSVFGRNRDRGRHRRGGGGGRIRCLGRRWLQPLPAGGQRKGKQTKKEYG